MRKPKPAKANPKPTKASELSDKQLMAALRGADPERWDTHRRNRSDQPAAGVPHEETPEDRAQADENLLDLLSAVQVQPGEPDAAGKLLSRVTGVKNPRLANYLMTQVVKSMNRELGLSASDCCMGAVAMFQEIKPETFLQTLLACQIIAGHNAAMKFLARAVDPAQTYEGTNANIERATQLMAIQVRQFEAMVSLKRTPSKAKTENRPTRNAGRGRQPAA